MVTDRIINNKLRDWILKVRKVDALPEILDMVEILFITEKSYREFIMKFSRLNKIFYGTFTVYRDNGKTWYESKPSTEAAFNFYRKANPISFNHYKVDDVMKKLREKYFTVYYIKDGMARVGCRRRLTDVLVDTLTFEEIEVYN